MKALGLVLVIIGLVGLVYGGVQWTQREKVVDLGPVEVTQEKHKSMPIPPIAGAVCVLAGAVILAAGRRS